MRTCNLIQKSLYNIKILEKYNKSDASIQKIKSFLTKNNDISFNELFYINKQIDRVFLSYSIHECFMIMNKSNFNKKQINQYEKLYLHHYYDNNKLYFLFKQIEFDIKMSDISKNKFIILPFYYNVYLKEMK